MNKDQFIEELLKINIKISNEELDKFEKYKNLLQEYNKKFNLTTIIKDEDIYLKHFYDSLCLMKIPEMATSKLILDIGTGAGFPGIPLAIINKDKQIKLVESNNKKISFLKVLEEQLNLKNVEIISLRAEEYAKQNREKFDIATSRAVSHLKILTEIEVPTLKVNGLFLPLKSNIDEEIEETKEFIKTIGADLKEIVSYTLPYENSKRTIIKIKKLKETEKNYPREYNKMLKDKNNKK